MLAIIKESSELIDLVDKRFAGAVDYTVDKAKEAPGYDIGDEREWALKEEKKERGGKERREALPPPTY